MNKEVVLQADHIKKYFPVPNFLETRIRMLRADKVDELEGVIEEIRERISNL